MMFQTSLLLVGPSPVEGVPGRALHPVAIAVLSPPAIQSVFCVAGSFFFSLAGAVVCRLQQPAGFLSAAPPTPAAGGAVFPGFELLPQHEQPQRERLRRTGDWLQFVGYDSTRWGTQGPTQR